MLVLVKNALKSLQWKIVKLPAGGIFLEDSPLDPSFEFLLQARDHGARGHKYHTQDHDQHEHILKDTLPALVAQEPFKPDTF